MAGTFTRRRENPIGIRKRGTQAGGAVNTTAVVSTLDSHTSLISLYTACRLMIALHVACLYMSAGGTVADDANANDGALV